jgi:hypothetical protein
MRFWATVWQIAFGVWIGFDKMQSSPLPGFAFCALPFDLLLRLYRAVLPA